jgi:cytochrome c553
MKFSFLIILFLVFSLASTAQSSSMKVPDTLEERVKPCTICHEDADKTGADAYYPRIAGKPIGYLFNQLQNFRDGRRYYQPMAVLLENMSDEYMLEIARYFASMQYVYSRPEPHSLPSDEIQIARKLINKGDSARDLPACSACHGEALMGVEPFIPGLLGLPHAYLAAQFGGWRNGGVMRGQTPDCMSEIAKKLTQEEVYALAALLPSQPVAGETAEADTLDQELVQECQDLFSEVRFLQ